MYSKTLIMPSNCLENIIISANGKSLAFSLGDWMMIGYGFLRLEIKELHRLIPRFIYDFDCKSLAIVLI